MRFFLSTQKSAMMISETPAVLVYDVGLIHGSPDHFLHLRTQHPVKLQHLLLILLCLFSPLLCFLFIRQNTFCSIICDSHQIRIRYFEVLNKQKHVLITGLILAGLPAVDCVFLGTDDFSQPFLSKPCFFPKFS